MESDSLTSAMIAIIAGAGALYALFVYLAKARGKRIGLVTFLAFLSTVLLLCVNQMLAHGRIGPFPDMEDSLRFLAYLGVVFVMLRAIDLLLVEAILIDQKDFYLPPSLRMVLVGAGLVVTGVFLLHRVMGVNLIALVAVPTVLTAVVGIALKDTLARVACGVMLGRMMREGDWVTLNGHEGCVAEISLGQITLHNRAGDAVMLPNDVVVRGIIENHNRPVVHHASTVLVEALYVHSPREVIRLLVEAARAVQGVLSEPLPVCFATSFKGPGIEYRLRFWFDDFTQRQRLESDVLTYTWHALRRNGIEISYVQRPMPATGVSLPSPSSEALDGTLKQLSSVDFLAALSESELGGLAQSAKMHTYLCGEAVVRQGDRGDEFFVLTFGEAAVQREGAAGIAEVARLGPGDCFGEMSLLTGEPRSATVRALTELSLLVLDKRAMSGVFSQNQVLIERVARVVQQRQGNLREKLETQSRIESRERTAPAEDDLIDRIRDFFGL